MISWKEICGSDNAAILRWAETRPWSRRMAECQQDAGWHAEGDVWTHTKMVCGELEKLPEWPHLDRADQIKLLFTGFFHDAGKPATTIIDPETGRTRSPKHSLAGMNMVREELRDLGCDLATREAIAALVRFHGRPPYLLEKSEPEREVISLSWFLSNRLIYLFALADTRGRVTHDTSRAEETLHFWKELSEEQACYKQPYPFANDQARFLFFREKLSSLHYTPREEYRCRVLLMSGVPGAGKDTWLAQHRPGLPVVSLDEIRSELDVDPGDNQGHVIQAARELCRVHLRAGQDFAFNATNLTRQLRQRWLNLFADYSARVQIVYLEPLLSTILSQNKSRERDVPEKVIHHLLAKLEPPTLAEAHELVLCDGK